MPTGCGKWTRGCASHPPCSKVGGLLLPPPIERLDFPACARCPYVDPGSWTTCYPCASEQLASIVDPCPICSQEQRGAPCHNSLCTGKAGPRYIKRIEAITLHRSPLSEVIKAYKYRGKTGWGLIFARLLVGHLNNMWAPWEIDRIIANPASDPDRDHNMRVLEFADLQDPFDIWPFDSPTDPTITKATATPQSAGKDFGGKQDAAQKHAQSLQLRHPTHITNQRIIVYDDVCTTGLQLNEVARQLHQWGATTVHGIVLARQPWT